MGATFPVTTPTPTNGAGVSLALTQVVTPENPVLGDLDFNSFGQFHLWDQRQARYQKVMIVLQFGLGEWWMDPSQGIPYFGTIIGTRRVSAVPPIFRQALQRTLPDLAEIRSLKVDFDKVTRVATVTFDLRFDDGTAIRSDDFGPLEIKI